MSNKGKIRFILTITIFICSMLLGVAPIVAQAKDDAFVIEAQMLPTDDLTYCVQLTVENLGEDWEGIVRLTINSGYGASVNCAYDTVLSLPQGSTKQFEVRLPMDSVDRTDGYVIVRLLDQKGKTCAEKSFAKLLQDRANALSMGILSDSYASLTYLDMGGAELSYGNRNRPIKLVQLSQGSVTASLDTLTFLVIDSYDTKALTEEEVEQIANWVDKGGILLVGTGNNAEKTLGGLSFLGIAYEEVEEHRGSLFDLDYYIDTSQLSLVNLEDAGDVFGERHSKHLGLNGSWGDGAVSVLPFALAQISKLRTDAWDYDGAQEEFVEMILVNASNFSQGRYSSKDAYYENNYNLQRIFPSLGKGSNQLKFGGLKALVILYVIFVGPVLYLILRALKKRDFYWLAVPVATLVGIFLVYWAGRGFEVASTNVHSVTVENLSGKGTAMTYLRCYDAGHKEWKLQMAEGYTFAGPLMNRYYYGEEENDYYHRIQKEGDRLFVGMNPKVGFEDGYFTAGAKKEAPSGTISWDGGNVFTNETQYDFSYFAVIKYNSLIVYKNFKAGQRFDIEKSDSEYVDAVTTAGAYARYSSSYTPSEAYFYGYLRDSLREGKKEDIDLKAALGIGISAVDTAADLDQIVIVGVVENWDKTIADDCSEVSYGCLYTVID